MGQKSPSSILLHICGTFVKYIVIIVRKVFKKLWILIILFEIFLKEIYFGRVVISL